MMGEREASWGLLRGLRWRDVWSGSEPNWNKNENVKPRGKACRSGGLLLGK